ncbi:MAG: hypothetical protein ACFCBW_20945 [Candidatus Competibacterales bacterium]
MVDHWQLSSTTGREVSRWTVTQVTDGGHGPIYHCDVQLTGWFYGETLCPTVAPESDFTLTIRGLQVPKFRVLRLVDALERGHPRSSIALQGPWGHYHGASSRPFSPEVGIPCPATPPAPLRRSRY